MSADIAVRPMKADDVPEADRIFRVAFATYLQIQDPQAFMTGREMVRGRFGTDPSGAIVAVDGDKVVGSNLITNWGAFGFFGPLTIDPALWGKGIAKRLMAATLERFASWETRSEGLFTFSDSVQHQALYQRFGFWPRFLTAVMRKAPAAASAPSVTRFSQLTHAERLEALLLVRDLGADALEGLDIGREVQGIDSQSLGETLFLWSESRLEGIAFCHFGNKSEAGENSCYVKFAVARPGPTAAATFDGLLDACEALAVEMGVSDIEIGANAETVEAYKAVLQHGFKPAHLGVYMHRGEGSGIYRPDLFVAADLR